MERNKSGPPADIARPEVVRLPGAGGLMLTADAYGDRGNPPVVLFHGGGQTRRSWHTTARTLGARGWRAISVDLRGHGESEWPDDGDYRLDAFTGDVLAIASELASVSDTPPALVGASLGGVAALVAVGESSTDVTSALVLVDIAHRIESDGSERIGNFMREHMEEGFGSVEEVAAAVAAYNPHRPPPSNLSGLMRNLRRREDGRWVWHWDPRFLAGQGGSPDETRVSLLPPERLEAAARSLRVPTLLVRGRMSDVLSEEGARQFLELVPHAAYVDVAGAGHMVAGDRNDAFNDAIVQFLEPVRQA
jgi:pimeloyl-ACP methyl ester carboxylesterase